MHGSSHISAGLDTLSAITASSNPASISASSPSSSATIPSSSSSLDAPSFGPNLSQDISLASVTPEATALSTAPTAITTPGAEKRSRSSSSDAELPASKNHKPDPDSHVSYLARQLQNDLPLITTEDSLSWISQKVANYHAVVDRQESLAGNLGARPLGPILLKRFERLFEGPPKIIKSNAKDDVVVTWLDVIEFARIKPDQFTLSQMSEGARVCQFYTKQCRIQISEEDFFLITSGIPQKMIPPQPIVEDEDKELGTIEIMNSTLSNILQLAEQVTIQTRLLMSRLHTRRQAILDRRLPLDISISTTPASLLLPSMQPMTHPTFLSSPSRHLNTKNGMSLSPELLKSLELASPMSEHTRNTSSATTTSSRLPVIDRGRTFRSSLGSYTLLAPFTVQTTPNLSHIPYAPTARMTTSSSISVSPNEANTSASIGSIGSTSSFQPTGRSGNNDTDGQPFRAIMIARSEVLNRGERIMPPCDRCRRLHMDCIKNLTACMGCTKKHAKCSWWEVKTSELSSGEVRDAYDNDVSPSDCLTSSNSLLTPTNSTEGSSLRDHTSFSHHHHHHQDSQLDTEAGVDAVSASFPYSNDVSLGTPFNTSVSVGLPSTNSLSADNQGASTLAVLGEFGINSLDKYTSGVDVGRFRTDVGTSVNMVGLGETGASGMVPLDSSHAHLSHSINAQHHQESSHHHHPQTQHQHQQHQHSHQSHSPINSRSQRSYPIWHLHPHLHDLPPETVSTAAAVAAAAAAAASGHQWRPIHDRLTETVQTPSPSHSGLRKDFVDELNISVAKQARFHDHNSPLLGSHYSHPHSHLHSHTQTHNSSRSSLPPSSLSSNSRHGSQQGLGASVVVDSS